jgi:hypothetical protein
LWQTQKARPSLRKESKSEVLDALWEADYNVPASNATALRAIRSLTVVATVNVGAYVSITVFPTNTCSSTPTDSTPNESDQWVLARNFVV